MDYPQLEPVTKKGKAAVAVCHDRVLVGVRIRPMLSGTDGDKAAQQKPAIHAEGEVVVGQSGGRVRDFPFDYVFTKEQDEVYDCIGRQMLREAFNGYNVCLFAYGQTGSGKTYTLQGLPGAGLPRDVAPTVDNEGLVPRICRDLFSITQAKCDEDSSLQIRVTLSLTEVYNEKVRDLLPATKPPKGQEPPSLDVYEGTNKRIEVKGLTKHTVISYEKLMNLMQQGNGNREVAETKMNECSSRSHQITQLHVVQQYDRHDSNQEKRDCEAFITIVDLAGSERQSKTGTTGEQFKESTHINHSLLMLGRALNSFSEGRQKVKVPLRDSKLTRLLSESFGGNSKTWMLATVSPSAYNLTETLSTLNYASNAKNITNNAKQNRLAKALELSELRTHNKELLAAIDREEKKHREYEADIARLMKQHEVLQGLKADRKEVEDLQLETTKLKTARESAHHTQQKRRDVASVPHGLTQPRSDLYIGRAKISLKNIIEQTSNYHTLPLSNESPLPVQGGFNAVLIVNIYPVDHQVCFFCLIRKLLLRKKKKKMK